MIFRNNRWIKNLTIDTNDSLEIAKEFNISANTAKLILQLGIEKREDIKKFLDSDIRDLNDPFLLKNMDKLVEHINYMVSNNHKVCIYGDYDVDGITSVSILLSYFRKIGLNSSYYIPDRIEEGYGLNINAIEEIKALGCNCIISVDCGITSVEEAKKAKELGIQLFITDHHQCQETLPDCDGIVNPKQIDCTFPFKNLAGAGIAFKIVQAHSGEKFKEIYKEYIDMSAIGTIADITPLVDENRIIAKYGLIEIENSNNIGIRELLKVSGLEGKEINSGHIGFNIGPRLNASGRVGSPKLGVELLTGSDPIRCREIAENLDQLNHERQDMEKDIFEQCISKIEDMNYFNDDIIVVEGENWHSGVIGIVASRISDRYYKPSIVLSIDRKIAKGSARSVGGFDIFLAMNSCKDLFMKFGGHKMAAGLSLKSENINSFRDRINKYASENLKIEDKTPGIKIGAELSSKDINHDFLEEMEILKPYGFGNPKPVFLYKDLSVDSVRFVGKERNHFKGVFHDDFRTYDAIKFNSEDIYSRINGKSKIDLAFNIEKNNFRGVETIQFNIKDIFIKDYVPDEFFKNFMFSYIDSISIGNFYGKERAVSIKKENEFFQRLNEILLQNEKFTIYAGSIYSVKIIESFLSDNNYFNYQWNFRRAEGDDFSKIIINPVDLEKISIENMKNILIFDVNESIIPDEFFNKGLVYFSREYNIELRKIIEEFRITKESYSRVYKNILSYRNTNLDIHQIAKETAMSYSQIYFSIMVFFERNLIKLEFQEENLFFVSTIAQKEKVNLFDSKLIKTLG